MANNIKINNPLGAQPQQKKGSGFVNLNKILQANSGNHLGQTVSSGLNQGAQQVQQGLGDVKNQFIQESDKSNLASAGNKQAVSDALTNIAGGQTNVSDDQAKQFGTFLSGQYNGPTALDATKTAQLGSKAQELQGLGQSLSGGGDKTRLLQAFAGKGPYTSGQTRLDSLLLGQGPNAKQQLAGARQNTRGLTQQIGNEQNTAQQIGQLRTGEAQQFGKDVLQNLQGAEQTNQAQIDAQKDPFIQGQKNLLTQLYSAGANLTPEQAAFIGQGGGTGFKAPGEESRQVIGVTSQVPLGEPGAGVYTSPQQRAAFEALAKLQGNTYTAPTEQYIGSPEQSFTPGVGGVSMSDYINYIKQVRAEEAAKYKYAGNPGAGILPPGNPGGGIRN